MHHLVLSGVIAGIFFLTSVVLFFIAIKKRSKASIYFSLGFFLLAICAGLWLSYAVVVKLHNKVDEALKPRSGIEIYTALFGKPVKDCVHIISYQDQVIPKIDYAVWLHFETCPAEMRRILSLRTFEIEIKSTNDMTTMGPNAQNTWFDPRKLGDSVLVFNSYKPADYGNGQTIYMSKDSTAALCKDVQD